MDVQMLHKIGNALKYNFFKHFPIDDDKPISEIAVNASAKLVEEKEKEIKTLLEKLSEKEKLIESLERESSMLKQENGYLKEINELLEKEKKK